jgi:ribonuclease D
VSDAETEGEQAPQLPDVELLDVELLGGVPDVVTTQAQLDRAIASLTAGSGPVAVDAERASGFRYGQRAYLVQFFRRGGGTWLIDPTAFDDLTELNRALSDVTWILHAASQDLPCLREVGLVPRRIFDTELGARLLGRDRVGLGPLVESELGLHLAKGHGAADWSKRPLPQDWLAYAALDVEVLVDLHDILAQDLESTGKMEYATQEFDAVLSAPGPAPRQDPWRRTSGMHRVRGRRQLATVRALWESRDELARRLDISPGRILSDAAIVAAAVAQPADADALGALPEYTKGNGAKHRHRWWTAIALARGLPESDLPLSTLPSEGPPPARVWRDKDPVAADRLARARESLAAVADDLAIPLENLVPPDAVRRCAWNPPETLDAETTARMLADNGARPWQVALVAAPLAAALADRQE